MFESAAWRRYAINDDRGNARAKKPEYPLKLMIETNNTNTIVTNHNNNEPRRVSGVFLSFPCSNFLFLIIQRISFIFLWKGRVLVAIFDFAPVCLSIPQEVVEIYRPESNLYQFHAYQSATVMFLARFVLSRLAEKKKLLIVQVSSTK